jgi:hypothetical protein
MTTGFDVPLAPPPQWSNWYPELGFPVSVIDVPGRYPPPEQFDAGLTPTLPLPPGLTAVDTVKHAPKLAVTLLALFIDITTGLDEPDALPLQWLKP